MTTACSRPEETCFCNVFGIDATEPEGDVVTWIADGVLYWEAKTEKGEALTAKVASLLEESDTAAVEDRSKSNYGKAAAGGTGSDTFQRR